MAGTTRTRRRGWVGALSGLLLTGPLSAFLFFGARALETAFPPYVLFEWIAGLLPGPVVTRAIDSMVGVIRALGFEDTAAAAKRIEAAMGVTLYALLCAAIGAGLFVALYRARTPARRNVVLLIGTATLAVLSSVPAAAMGELGTWGALWTLVGSGGFVAVAAFVQQRLHSRHADGGWATVSSADRRRVIIRLAGASAVLTLAGLVLSRRLTQPHTGGGASAGTPWSSTHAPPNADADVQPVAGTRPELTPVSEHYRIDITIRPPAISLEDWRLKIDGRVKSARSFTLAQLQALPVRHEFITLSCISNPVGGDLIGTTRWSGVSLSRVLEEVELLGEATHLRVYAADGFDEVVSLEQVRADPRVMLAWAWDGLPLTPEHGFPLRIYIPDRYGMKQPKWIERIEATPQWQPGYWVRRGWDREAQVRATSVIDVIGPEPVRDASGRLLLPVGGIAFAGTRGIARVEVRVDEGPWMPAQLREPLSEKTWVLWRYEWPFEEGEHTFTVRTVDGQGQPQLEAASSPHPSGATGLHRRRVDA